MTDAPPTPPPALPADAVDRFDDYSAEQLHAVASYAAALAAHREARRTDREREADDPDRPEDRPADVPAKATLTVKEINDNRYYYWQWREGDQIKSAYEGPVDAGE
ncbi:MAG: hypothetical protein ABEJ23_02490 [Haloarculaceae archaeon]